MWVLPCSCDHVGVPRIGANSKTFLLSAKLFSVSSVILPEQSLVQFLVTPKSSSDVSVQLPSLPTTCHTALHRCPVGNPDSSLRQNSLASWNG